MAMDEEDGHARVQEPESRSAVLSGAGEPRSRLERAAAGDDRPGRSDHRTVHAGTETAGPEKDSAQGNTVWHGRDGRIANRHQQDFYPGARSHIEPRSARARCSSVSRVHSAGALSVESATIDAASSQ